MSDVQICRDTNRYVKAHRPLKRADGYMNQRHHHQVAHAMPVVTRTTTTCVYFAIRAELDAMHRTVMTLENFPFFTIHPMDPNPFISEISRNKAILQDGMDGSRRWRVWEVQTVSWRRARQGRYKCHGFSRRDNKPFRL